MSLTQIVVILAGLFAGYRLVGYMLSPGTGDDDKRTPEDAGSDTPQPQRWYEVLEVSESASREEITRAWRQKLAQYHPDKVATLGDDIRAVAEEQTKRINAAYEEALKS